jgi:hypothetical protein
MSYLNEIKVGDEVGYHRTRSYGSILGHGFGLVAKINRHGHIILDNGIQFDRYGDERNVKYAGRRLISADHLREILAVREQQKARNEAANELKSILEGQRNGYGDTCKVDENLRAKMIALINQL